MKLQFLAPLEDTCLGVIRDFLESLCASLICHWSTMLLRSAFRSFSKPRVSRQICAKSLRSSSVLPLASTKWNVRCVYIGNGAHCLTFPSSRSSRYFSSNIESDFDTHDDFKPQTKQQYDMKDIHELIAKDVKENPLMIYMKGSPNMPQCGFSKTVVDIIRHMGYDFRARNVLSNDLLRQGIKEYSDWPTVPQVYVKGEFVGGCDIMIEMFKDGSLEELLDESGVVKVAELQAEDPQ
uniref:Glutaredoxin domain-containing protein n=1 Tax=Lotharella globosa TaxID=91324 RepID=A0A7S4DYZ9_9EUKA